MTLTPIRPSLLCRTVCSIVLTVVPSVATAADKQTKVLEAEAKRLMTVAEQAERAGRLLDARASYLAAEQNLYSKDAENALERVAALIARKVTGLVNDAARAYGAGDFAKAAELLGSAALLEPANAPLLCNLAAVSYKQRREETAVELLDECLATLPDRDSARAFAEMRTALVTADWSVVAEPLKAQVMRLNEHILRVGTEQPPLENQPQGRRITARAAVCESLSQMPASVSIRPAMSFNRAACAEFDNRLAEAIESLTAYRHATPAPTDTGEIEARLAALHALAALPGETGDVVRRLHASAKTHAAERQFAEALADYRQADRALGGYSDTERQLAALFEARGQVDSAVKYWQSVLAHDVSNRWRAEASSALDELPAQKARYEQLIGESRQSLRDLLEGPLLSGRTLGHFYAADVLQRANASLQSAAALFPLAPEVNALQAFICMQLNDFVCVRGRLDMLQQFGHPAFFYASVFDNAVKGDHRPQESRTYVKFELDRNTVRMATISTAKPKKRTATVAAVPAGEDRLGNVGVPEGLGTTGFDGTTVRNTAISHLESRNGLLYLELNDATLKHRKMFIEPLSLAVVLPAEGAGARKYINQYLGIIAKSGDVPELGSESITVREKLGMAYTAYQNGAGGLLTTPIALEKLRRRVNGLHQQARQLLTLPPSLLEVPFKAVPIAPQTTLFLKDVR